MSLLLVLVVAVAGLGLVGFIATITTLVGLGLFASHDPQVRRRAAAMTLGGAGAAIVALIATVTTGAVLVFQLAESAPPAPLALPPARTDLRQPIEPVLLPAELSAMPEIAPIDDEHAGARYLQRVRAVRYVAGQDYRTTLYLAVELLDDSGVNEFTTIPYTFDPTQNAVYVNYLRVLDPQGRIVAEGNPDDYHVVDSGGDLATDDRELRIPVPALRAGRRIELAITDRSLNPADTIGFFDYNFSAAFPTVRSALYVTGDVDRLAWHANHAAPPRQQLTDGWLWVMHDPPSDVSEPLWEERDRYLPFVYLGNRGATWPGEARDYLELIAHRCRVPPVTRALAERLTRGTTDRRQRLLAIAQHVQREYTYQGIEFGEKAWVMNDTARTVSSQYGDCKDLSLLVCQLLQSSGEPAHLALVATEWPLIPQIPTVDQFDHMIVYLPEFDGGRFFDPTDRDIDPLLPIPYGMAGRTALVLDPDRPRLVELGGYPADSSTIDYQRHVVCREDGDVRVRETVTFGGYQACEMRSELRNVVASDRQAALQSLMVWAGTPLRLLRMRIDHLDDADQPLRLELEYEWDGLLHQQGRNLAGRLPAVWEAAYISPEFVPQRQTPFWLEFPLRVRGETTIEAGTGSLSVVLPNRQRGQDEFFAWQTEIEQQDGSTRIHHQLDCATGRFPPDQYPLYCNAARSARNAFTPRITLRLPAPSP